MSKNISIQESGVAQTLNTISTVVTSGQKGSVDWVPEDEVQLGNVTIKSNGEYKASEQNLYAFDVVTVHSSGKAVGKNKTTGDWEVVSVDENGKLIRKSLPTRIAVVTPPTKTNYESGEVINTAGMVVKAYYSDDSEYGTVYKSQYTIEPKKATDTTITVKWNRDGDKRLLTTTFSITIGA